MPVAPGSFIKSQVEITTFILYNMTGADVEILSFDPRTGTYETTRVTGGKGTVQTPRNNPVMETTVHTKIRFAISEFFGHDFIITRSEDTGVTKH
jgi:hypothetical protein